MKTDIQKLFDELKKFNKYPVSMSKIFGDIKGVAFFPGGKGIYYSESLSDKKIMVLGHNFDTEKNYLKYVDEGSEDVKKNSTWRNILEFLPKCNISPMDCFFTNAFLGAKRDGKSVGKLSASSDKKFKEYCLNFFLREIEIQKPKLILVLGLEAAHFLAPLNEKLNDWGNADFKSIDENDLQVIKSVKFPNGVTSNLVVLTHPSMRQISITRRTYKKFSGDQAEVEMVKEALKK
jgi:hypothetical protein